MLMMPPAFRCSLVSGLALLAIADGCVVVTGGGPDECVPVDSSTRVDVVVDYGDYPVGYETPRTDPEGGGADGYRIDDVPCTATLVDRSDSSRVRTELDCETGDGNYAITVEHAATDHGDPVWAAGDSLLLSVDLRIYSDLNEIPLVAVALRTPEGEPLLLAIDSDELTEGIVAPFELSLDADACPGETSEATRGRVTLGYRGFETEVLDGNDGSLSQPENAWAVELEQAVTDDFGERSLLFEMLVVKVL